MREINCEPRGGGGEGRGEARHAQAPLLIGMMKREAMCVCVVQMKEIGRERDNLRCMAESYTTVSVFIHFEQFSLRNSEAKVSGYTSFFL